MAIRDFGESILADVRKRNDDQRRRDEGGTLGKIQRGLKTIQDVAEIGQSFGFFGGTQDDKYNKFKTNKDVMDTNINIGRAEANTKLYDATEKAIAASGYSTNEYFLNQTVKETLDESLKLSKNAQYALDKEAQEKYRLVYGAELRNLDKVKEAAAFATEKYAEFGKVRENFTQTGTTKEAMDLAKSKIPSTLRSIGSVFTGKDLTQEVVDSFTTSLRAQGATQVQVFQQILDATGGDFTKAVDLAEEAGISKEALENATKQTTEHIDTGNGQIVSVEYRTDIHGNKTVVENSAQRTDLRTEQQRVTVKKANFNPQSVIVSQLNNAGQTEAMKMGFMRGQIDTEIAYKKNVTILNKLLNAVDTKTGNTLYIKPVVSETEKSRNQLKGTLVGALYNDAEFLRAQTDVEKQSGFMAEEREKIVASNPKINDEEIETLLLENDNYKNAYASFTKSTSMVISKQNNINDVVNATFPLPSDPDDAETADIKAGSTSTGVAPVVGATGKIVTATEVAAVVSGATTVNELTNADITAWAKANNQTGLSIEDLKSGYGEQLLSSKKFRAARDEQNKKNVEDGIAFSEKLKNKKEEKEEEKAKLAKMNYEERKYYRKTGKFPSRIVEMFKDGMPSLPPVTKNNSRSSISGKKNMAIRDFGESLLADARKRNI
tara:strand:- start:615 stop:2603 length:1989 start_codon:yes stop_codon:yes gene_type:complete